jgi:hypothetical protein
MKNPGLNVFAYVHPKFETIMNPHDPDYVDVDDPDNDSDYMPGVNFGRWRTPGKSIHVPLHQGPTFAPGESPEDAINAEVVSPAEQDSADRIIHGEHESAQPSDNPYVAKAQQDLHTPGSDVAVDTLSSLLRGARPQSMGQEAMDAAHAWLSQRFTGVRVNPHHGVLEAASPAGSQMVKRHVHLPAIPEQPAESTYSLTNKHGTFESDDPQRLVRAMMAFQIVHNEIMQARRKKKDDDDDQSGLAATSGLLDWVADRLHGSSKPSPLVAPPSAVFEPGRGIDKSPGGKLGGYVMPAATAPLNWWKHQGTAYSPGHHMRLMLDPHEAVQPRNDPRFPGHTFTYAPNPATGHTTQRLLGHVNYFVQDLVHPAARNAGFDLLPGSKPAPAGRMPKRGPKAPAHTPPRSLPPAPPSPAAGPKTSAVATNDLCPVCASGYLEPYDQDTHECLNCGSLVKHVGFEKAAAAKRPQRGGLGRGFKDIAPYEGDPLNLASGGSENPDNVVDLDETYAHPLAGETHEEETYQAPKDLLGKKAAEIDPIDEHMGKLGFQPHHEPGQSRMYMMQMPGTPGGHLRLTEGVPTAAGVPSGWALTADHVPSRDQWTVKNHSPYPKRSILLDRLTNKPGEAKPFKQPLPDLGERQMASKTFLAGGHHPIEDPALNFAIRDVAKNGRNSHTYWNAFNDTAYEPPSPHPKGSTQRELRGLSSVNPGLVRFASVS